MITKITSDLNKVSGIYCLLFKTESGTKKYVGSSINIKERLFRHLNNLKNNKHSNSYIQNIYNKYGPDFMDYTILERDVEKEQLVYREQYFVDLLKSELNICKEIIRNTPSEESRIKIANTLKDKVANGQIKHSGTDKKQVYVFKDGQRVNEFNSINEASRFYNIPVVKISAVCNNYPNRKTTGGYQFSFNSNVEKLPTYSKNRTYTKSCHINLEIVEENKTIHIEGGIHGLYKWLSHNFFENKDNTIKITCSSKIG
jgi:hypothetical protein